MININCYTNTKRTFYLTANFERTDFKENKLFQFCFKSVPKYIQKERNVAHDSKKHIEHIVCFYNSKPSMVDIAKCKNKLGYFDKNAFAKYQMNKDAELFPILDEFINVFTINKGLKTFLTFSSIDACNEICKYYRSKGINAGCYHSKINGKIKEENLKNCDLIVTTFKSLGTGADEDVTCVINLESFDSKITANQLSGRLRKGYGKSYYIEIVNKGFHSIYRQYKDRYNKLFKKVFGSIKILDKTK